MRERAHMINGTLLIENHEKGGTKVKLIVPLSTNNQ